MSTLLSWAFGASVLILAVLALRFLLKNKLSARWRYALWAVVLVRLLVPLQIPLPLPAFLAGLTPELPYQMNYPTVSDHPRVEPPEEFVSTSQTYLEDGTAAVYTHTRADGTTVTTTIPILTRYQVLERRWGASALLAGAVLLAANGTFFLRLRKRRRPLEVPDCPLPVYAAEGLPSPCLFGLFRPAVYLTPEAAALPGEQRRHILAHELTHHAHRDHIWALLRCLCLALHWYNPLVWLAAVLSKADGELACDEGAVARLGESERVPYGRTLIGLSVRGTRPADLFQCSTAMTGGKKTLRDRVAALARKPETRKTALFAAAALLALAAVFTFAGRAERAHPDYADFRFQLRQAQAIRFTPPLYSSSFYPDPITDEDLLEEAKTILGTARDLLNVPEELDLSDAEFVSASVTLVNTKRDPVDENAYLLYRWNNKTYMLVHDDSRYIPVVVMDASGNALNDLARRQWERNMDTPEWRKEVLSSALRSVTEIQFQFSDMDAVYPAITDPDLLEQAAEVLRSGDPQDGTVEEGGAQVSIRDEKGGRLADFPLSNGEMIRTLDRLAMEQRDRNRAADGFINELTQEQLDRANEAFRPDVELPDGSIAGPSEISCFFTSSYSSPTQINLNSFLDYCPIGVKTCLDLENGDVEEFRAVMKAAGEDYEEFYQSPSVFYAPVHRYPRKEVSALLQKYSGVTVEELDWPDSLIYLEEYDAFYNFTSDYGPGTFYCTGGRVEGDTVRLWSDPHGENGARGVLTLRRDGDRYLLQSFQSVPG